MLSHTTQNVQKMHSRRNPDLSVSSTAYSQLSPSVTSATFLSPTIASRRALLGPSPPLSPSLPSLIPRHGKKLPPAGHSRSIKRLCVGCLGIGILLWVVVRLMFSQARQATIYGGDGGEWEMIGGSQLPEEPSALIVHDEKGSSKWTVSIPSTLDFPLKPAHYHDICQQATEVSTQLPQNGQLGSGNSKRTFGFYTKDKNYIDVQEAEDQAMLPKSTGTQRPKSLVNDELVASQDPRHRKVCERSLTYVMETRDAGFGVSLMRLWMAYGLAKAENRAFFVDDSRWLYGKYSDYFIPLAAAGCLAPPMVQMVPCPHTARHIVVSGATVSFTFGHAFTDEWEDATKHGVQRQHRIFSLLRTGYRALFKLRADDAAYVLERSTSLYGPTEEHGGMTLGIHVRRGDRHPYEFQYQKDYVPLDRYLDTARAIYIDRVEDRLIKKVKQTRDGPDAIFARHTASRLILASDDPAVYDSGELGPNTVRAQDRIILATKATLEAAQGKKNPWIDEITGWEGGFFRQIFLSLGQANENANGVGSTEPAAVCEGAMRLRELVGRAYLLDLAVLSNADAVICTVSSTGCRLLAVMMGWDEAIVKGNWINVDGDFDWRGIMW